MPRELINKNTNSNNRIDKTEVQKEEKRPEVRQKDKVEILKPLDSQSAKKNEQ
jgi:hypothetical protein